MPKPTTTEIGEKFARQVFDIIRLKYPDAKREHLVGTKKVDIYFEESRLGKRRRVAVECKGYSAVLHRSELDEIHGSYIGLHGKNLIDEILVVTRHGLGGDHRTDFLQKLLGVFAEVYPKMENRDKALGVLSQALLLLPIAGAAHASLVMTTLLRSIATRAKLRSKSNGVGGLRRSETGVDHILGTMQLLGAGKKGAREKDVVVNLHGVANAVGAVLKDRWCISEWCQDGGRIRPEGRHFPDRITLNPVDRSVALAVLG